MTLFVSHMVEYALIKTLTSYFLWIKYVPLPHIKRNLTVYEIDKAIIYCCLEIGI